MKTLRSRREYYRGIQDTMTQEEIIRTMPIDELRMNARKGGKDAIKELERRNAAVMRANRILAGIIPDNDIDIGV